MEVGGGREKIGKRKKSGRKRGKKKIGEEEEMVGGGGVLGFIGVQMKGASVKPRSSE